MSKEFENRYDLGKGLIPSDKLPYGYESWVTALNVMVYDDGLSPFAPKIIAGEECQVLYTNQHIYIINEVFVDVLDKQGNIINSFSVLPGYWCLLDFLSTEIIFSGTQNIIFSEADWFTQNDLVFLPIPLVDAINYNQQVFGTTGDNIVHVSAIGSFSFEINESNEAGQIILPHDILAIRSLGSRLMAFTKGGIYELRPGVQEVAVSLYHNHVIAGPHCAWSSDRCIVYITNQGEVVKLWHNGERQSFGLKYKFPFFCHPFIKGYYCTLLDCFFIYNGEEWFILTDQGITQTSHTIWGYFPSQENTPVFIGTPGNPDFHLQSHWFQFAQISKDLMRACEFQGNLLKPFGIWAWFMLRNYRGQKAFASKRIQLGPNGQITPMLVAAEFQLVMKGQIDSFKSLNTCVLRFQRHDYTQIRGATGAV